MKRISKYFKNLGVALIALPLVIAASIGFILQALVGIDISDNITLKGYNSQENK